MVKSQYIIGSILLVSGTSIGGGMLALPVITGLGGFLPSVVIYFLTWAFMASTGLLLLEACLWMNKETNIISLAESTLGRFGKIFSWLIYLFFFYSLTTAYVAGSASLINELLGGSVSYWVSGLVFIALFAPFIYLGARAVESVNLLLMVGLGLSFFAFVVLGLPLVKTERFMSYDISFSLIAFPVVFTAFGYQGIVPSLTMYLRREPKIIRFVILMGSLIPLLIYILWEWLILGIIPLEGNGGLIEALQHGDSAIPPLRGILGGKVVAVIGQYFGFFALATSVLGVTLGLRDFLADGLNIKKSPKGKIVLCFLIFAPPLIFSIINPHIFIAALSVAGGFGASILLGLLPILMVFSGRYYKKYTSSYVFPGGKFALLLLFLFVSFEIILELLHALGLRSY